MTDFRALSVTLKWSEERQPCEDCRYNHCVAETPFGKFVISWKGWKEYPTVAVDEAPFGDWFECWNSVEDAKAACQAEYSRRLADAIDSALAQPEPTDDRVGQLEAELERERLRLAACGVVAMADTPESAAKARDMSPEYHSASLDDVIRQIDALMELRAALAQPEPQGLTDEELLELAAKALGYKSIAFYETRLMAEAGELLAYARAVLAADRARAALDRPEPQEPTDEELAATFAKGCRDSLGNPDQPPFLAGARAVLAQWGRPGTIGREKRRLDRMEEYQQEQNQLS